MRFRYVLLSAFILTWLVMWLTGGAGPSADPSDPIMVTMEILGGTIAMIAISLVPAGLFVLWRRFRGRPTATITKAGFFVPVLLLVLILNALGSRAGNSDLGYVFNPAGCDYEVVFPDDYRLYEIKRATPDASRLVPIKGAHSDVDGGRSAVRAECVINEYDINTVTETSIQPVLDQIAADYGIRMPIYNWEQSGLGKIATITGPRGEESQPIMVQIINYHGPNSILTLYLFADAGIFPTDSMLGFRNSVRLRPDSSRNLGM